MKAIKTKYKGYKFRSRLEARYAVFFDAMGIDWEYEIEGYVLSDGTCYLPDFWLPTFNGGMWVEVKPKEFTEEEKRKCRMLCVESKYGVWLANGSPDMRCYEVYYWYNGNINEGDGIPLADQAEFENRMYGMSAYGKIGKMVNPEYRKLMGDTLINSVTAAKEATFEYLK
jgi:hypothetical protein